MKSALLLNVIIRKSAAIFQLLSGKNETLLVRRDAFFILNFRFNIVDSVRRFNLKGNSFSCEGLDENLHATAKTQDWRFDGLMSRKR